MISVKVTEMKEGKYLVRVRENGKILAKLESIDVHIIVDFVFFMREYAEDGNQYFEMTWIMPKKEDRVEVQFGQEAILIN